MGINDDTGIGSEGADLLTSGMGEEDNQSQDSGSGSDINQTGDAGDQSHQDQGAGSNLPAWMGQLSDDLKESDSLTKFKKVSDLGKSYIELEGKLGNSITIPGDDATDEEKAAFLGKLRGVEKAEDYAFNFREDMPEYLKKSFNGSESKLREVLFNSGLSQKQADSMLNWMQDEMVIGDKAARVYRKDQQEKAAATLKEEWGGDYDANINIMTNGLRRFAGDGFIKTLQETGLVNHPEMAKTFLAIGKAISEDTLRDGDPPGKDFDPSTHVLFT